MENAADAKFKSHPTALTTMAFIHDATQIQFDVGTDAYRALLVQVM